MTDLNELADRYVAVWNEPDPATRRAAVETPLDRGRRASRPTPAGDRRPGVRRRRGRVLRVGDAVKFSWEMVAAPDGRIRTDYQFIEG